MTHPFEDIAIATELVAREFDGPHCVDAAALLVEVGKRLGHDLEPVPVSLAAFADNGQSVATGDRGRAFAESYLQRRGSVAIGGDFTGGSPFQRHAGHMIVVSRESQLLLDPTFAQFTPLGEDNARPIFVDETLPRAGGLFWQVGDDTFFARYFAQPDYLSELNFDDVRAAWQAKADDIAAEVRVRLAGK